MYAGTIGKLSEPSPDPLASWANYDDHPPVLVVENTQGSLGGDGPAAQTGQATGRVETSGKDIQCGLDSSGQPYIEVDRTTPIETVVVDWVADVCGAGVVITSSVADDDTVRPFPFDLFTARTGLKCDRQQIAIQRLARRWRDDDVLTDVWMLARRNETVEGEAVSIDYGEAARLESVADATIGLGFERTYAGSTYRGVAYASGYVAVWRDCPSGEFIQFVTDELLPYCERFVPEEQDVDWDSFGGGS